MDPFAGLDNRRSELQDSLLFHRSREREGFQKGEHLSELFPDFPQIWAIFDEDFASLLSPSNPSSPSTQNSTFNTTQIKLLLQVLWLGREHQKINNITSNPEIYSHALHIARAAPPDIFLDFILDFLLFLLRHSESSKKDLFQYFVHDQNQTLIPIILPCDTNTIHPKTECYLREVILEDKLKGTTYQLLFNHLLLVLSGQRNPWSSLSLSLCNLVLNLIAMAKANGLVQLQLPPHHYCFWRRFLTRKIEGEEREESKECESQGEDSHLTHHLLDLFSFLLSCIPECHEEQQQSEQSEQQKASKPDMIVVEAFVRAIYCERIQLILDDQLLQYQLKPQHQQFQQHCNSTTTTLSLSFILKLLYQLSRSGVLPHNNFSRYFPSLISILSSQAMSHLHQLQTDLTTSNNSQQTGISSFLLWKLIKQLFFQYQKKDLEEVFLPFLKIVKDLLKQLRKIDENGTQRSLKVRECAEWVFDLQALLLLPLKKFLSPPQFEDETFYPELAPELASILSYFDGAGPSGLVPPRHIKNEPVQDNQVMIQCPPTPMSNSEKIKELKAQIEELKRQKRLEELAREIERLEKK